MGSNLNRWLVTACWLLALLALLSAASKGSMGVAAMWALPGALGVTLAVAGWPQHPMTRNIALLGAVWQMALIGAYWPFTVQSTSLGLSGPTHWPLHTLVIGGLLLLLVAAFLAAFLWPALALRLRLSRAAQAMQTQREQGLDAVGQSFRGDTGLLRAWQEYLHQVRPAPDAQGRQRDFAMTSAASMFDPHVLTQSRLRLDFFKNLPGLLTGLGIIGTFTGLIMGLRQFRISQDPGVVQASLEALLGGVWEAFLVSAAAIALAIAVTLIEKLALSSIARQADELVQALDGVYPPRPQQPDSEAWVPRLLEALQQLRAAPESPRRAPAEAPVEMVPLPRNAAVDTPATRAPERSPALEQMSQHTLQASQALAALAQQLPELLGRQQQQTQQALGQSMQVMKTLAGRLEGVASSIENSGRKTLETVAARLMQSEMNMVSRHQAVAEHLGELVQRIEALCGLLQTDRNEAWSHDTRSASELPPGANWPAREDPYREARDGRGARPGGMAPAGPGYALANGHAASDGFAPMDDPYGTDGWGEPATPPARFGS